MSNIFGNSPPSPSLDEIMARTGCSRRTAARTLRSQNVRREALNRQATAVAAHVDWDNRTDIAPEIREMAELIQYYGVRGVANAERDHIANKLPRALRPTKE